MAHRKTPHALRRRRNLSNPVFCMYTRKDYRLKSWTNRLKRLERVKDFTAKAKYKQKVKHSPNKNKSNNKKRL